MERTEKMRTAGKKGDGLYSPGHIGPGHIGPGQHSPGQRCPGKYGLGLLLAAALAAFCMAGCGPWEPKEEAGEMAQGEDTEEGTETEEGQEKPGWEAAHTPYGRYPEPVVYTLGKISGANNANLPVGDSYEDNAYTRYLAKMLNIQNQDVFELEDGAAYEQALEMAIDDNEIPDILVVKGRENLKKLVERGLAADLSAGYEECTTDRIKEMYASYGPGLLESACFEGRLYAFPDTVIDHGSMLLWLRKDWMEQIGAEEPETLEEGMEIVRRFVEADLAGEGRTTGLACSTELVSQSSSTYGVDPIFTCFGAVPQKWTLDEEGRVVYGSVTEETGKALSYLHTLYENGTIDSRFLLRTSENLDRMVEEGTCGAVFGHWWAPNNPLSMARMADQSAVWTPFLLTRQQRQTLESYNDRLYVAAGKQFEHPEIIAKYVSVLFDYTRYEDRSAGEINDYFSLNVDPTARPMNINVDYWDGLYRTTEKIQSAMDGQTEVGELTGIERAYYQTCKSYLNGTLTTVNGWSAYASRIQAVGLLAESGRGLLPLSMGEADGSVPPELKRLEKEAFIQIITGEKPLEYFAEFVEEWYAQGGRELTEEVQKGYEAAGGMPDGTRNGRYKK